MIRDFFGFFGRFYTVVARRTSTAPLHPPSSPSITSNHGRRRSTSQATRRQTRADSTRDAEAPRQQEVLRLYSKGLEISLARDTCDLVGTHTRSLARSPSRSRVDTRATTGASLCVLGLQHLCVLSLQRCSVRIELDTPSVLADRIVMNGTSREFGHRVKSVSMASFKPEEIERIKKGGNDVRVICYCYYCCFPLMLVGH